jgi:nucleoside-diphosphate-sugar epimerase
VITPIVILGAGYTGSRVARLLQAQGHPVQALRSADFDLLNPATHARLIEALETGARVLHSIPVLRTSEGYHATMPVLAPLLAGRAGRVVYLSTTGVYGDQSEVNEATRVAPRHERELLRVEEERAVLGGPWSALVLRPAAIYGPDRGIHESMRAGTHRLVGDGSNYISRIHVDDLAAISAAALLSDITGAYPVADLWPCPAREIAAYCAERFGYPMPPSIEALPESDTRGSDRRVDGRTITRLLGVALRYPSYREGLA